MEEKRLDLDRPLLSIRRPSSTHTSDDSEPKIYTLPIYKSDIKSGPVRNPGTVPFQWEHKPGKPKSDLEGLERPHFLPKLPPGRTLNVKDPASWRKVESKVLEGTCESVMVEDANSSRSEYDDCSEAYVDAIDKFSRSESFFFNCSVNGVDDPNLQPSEIFLSDPQIRDFMMGRFLPAAKALASETPPHSTRKLSLHKEQNEKVLPNTVQCSPSDHFQQQEIWQGKADEAESVKPSNTVPQICLKSSFGVPSMRMHAQKPVSVRRLRSNYLNSIHHENENKHADGSQRSNAQLNGSVPKGEDALATSFISQGKEEKVEKFHVSMSNSRSKNFGELLASDDNTWESCPESPMAEKALYVDIVHSTVTVTKVQKQNRDMRVDESRTRNQRVVHSENEKKIDLTVQQQKNCQRLLPPPLPKAPSDSWLKRTLPTMPSKKKWSTWTSLGNDNFTMISPANPKWEMMVKTSGTRQLLLHLSKEKLNPIPEA